MVTRAAHDICFVSLGLYLYLLKFNNLLQIYQHILEHLFIHCIGFNAVFNSILVISRWPVHLSMLSWRSFNKYSAQFSFLTTGCLTIVETTVSGEREMNPVAMTIINYRKEYWPTRGSNRLSYGARPIT